MTLDRLEFGSRESGRPQILMQPGFVRISTRNALIASRVGWVEGKDVRIALGYLLFIGRLRLVLCRSGEAKALTNERAV